MYQGAAERLLCCMTPEPQATWVPLTVSPQRHAIRQRCRRLAAQMLLRSSVRQGPSTGPTTTPQVPRRAQVADLQL
jgi:hypothetical protein